MRETPQRRHLVLIDGIVAGEGDGPLAPSPVDARALLFADDVALADRLACRLMGFDPREVPLVDRVGGLGPWHLGPEPGSVPAIVVEGRAVGETDVPAALGRAFRPPGGWVDRLCRAP
jgi:hypothetical protein